MRRSSSSTHIPIRLFGPSTGSAVVPPSRAMTRSNSVGRLSQQKESSVVKFRGTSLERKSKLSLPKTTPLSRHKSYANTPSSISSLSSHRSRISPAVGLREKKSIQKQSANPRWVNQQFKKVQNFILESQVFDQTVINPNNIKPPSIKGFIYLVTTLLGELYPDVKNITQANYKEEIVNKLKKLQYPGTMTNSTLKSVNTMHSWPQVIGMCGWLVDKIELKHTGKIDSSCVPLEERHKHLLPELINNYVCQRLNLFNTKNSPELIEEANQKYGEEFMKIIGCDPNEYTLIKTECDQIKEKQDKQAIKHELLLQESEALKANRDKLRNELATLEEKTENEQVELETEIAHFISTANKLTLKKNELESHIELLNQRKRNQPCSYQVKKELLLKSECLKNDISNIKGRINKEVTIKHKLDDEINEEHQKLQFKVIQWNHSLMEVCIKEQHLKRLLLKETGFHEDTFLENIREVAKMKLDIEIDLTKKIETLEVTFKQKNNEIRAIKNEQEYLQSEINQFILDSKQYDQEKAALDEDTKQILSDWEVQKRNLVLSVTDSPEVRQIKQLREENETLKLDRDNKVVELKQFGNKARKFFIDLDKQVDNNIKDLNTVILARRQQVEELTLKKLDEGESFIKFLDNSASGVTVPQLRK